MISLVCVPQSEGRGLRLPRAVVVRGTAPWTERVGAVLGPELHLDGTIQATEDAAPSPRWKPLEERRRDE